MPQSSLQLVGISPSDFGQLERKGMAQIVGTQR